MSWGVWSTPEGFQLPPVTEGAAARDGQGTAWIEPLELRNER